MFVHNITSSNSTLNSYFHPLLNYTYFILQANAGMTRKTAGQDNNTAWCEWCHMYRSPIRFDRHVKSCQLRHAAEMERQALSHRAEMQIPSSVSGVSGRHVSIRNCLISTVMMKPLQISMPSQGLDVANEIQDQPGSGTLLKYS